MPRVLRAFSLFLALTALNSVSSALADSHVSITRQSEYGDSTIELRCTGPAAAEADCVVKKLRQGALNTKASVAPKEAKKILGDFYSLIQKAKTPKTTGTSTGHTLSWELNYQGSLKKSVINNIQKADKNEVNALMQLELELTRRLK